MHRPKGEKKPHKANISKALLMSLSRNWNKKRFENYLKSQSERKSMKVRMEAGMCMPFPSQSVFAQIFSIFIKSLKAFMDTLIGKATNHHVSWMKFPIRCIAMSYISSRLDSWIEETFCHIWDCLRLMSPSQSLHMQPRINFNKFELNEVQMTDNLWRWVVNLKFVSHSECRIMNLIFCCFCHEQRAIDGKIIK